ncbi:uncharacterized protein LOC143190792 [Rhynchophorus ferrugineus]|uniref:uncharacterized protein LOC143190792 n=1 Tax=Rhynchophorus ferrugineus TaxID=354439 RepID=UPI003FCE5533
MEPINITWSTLSHETSLRDENHRSPSCIISTHKRPCITKQDKLRSPFALRNLHHIEVRSTAVPLGGELGHDAFTYTKFKGWQRRWIGTMRTIVLPSTTCIIQ